MYTIYTQNLCPYCTLAKRLLEEKGYEYKEINITHNNNAKLFLKGNGYKTVPQIFYNEIEPQLDKIYYEDKNQLNNL